MSVGKTEVYPFWNLEDIKGMVDAFTRHEQWHWRLAFMFGLLMGRRAGDTLNMVWINLYEPNGRRKPHLLIKEEKTKKDTYVLIPALIWSEVDLYISKTGVDPSVFFASTFSSKMQIEFLKVAWGISPVLHFLRRHSFRCRRGAVAGIQSLLVTDM